MSSLLSIPTDNLINESEIPSSARTSGGTEACVDECNAIIPTGVAPLSALVTCIACGDGPCAKACEGSGWLSYCE